MTKMNKIPEEGVRIKLAGSEHWRMLWASILDHIYIYYVHVKDQNWAQIR